MCSQKLYLLHNEGSFSTEWMECFQDGFGRNRRPMDLYHGRPGRDFRDFWVQSFSDFVDFQDAAVVACQCCIVTCLLSTVYPESRYCSGAVANPAQKPNSGCSCTAEDVTSGSPAS